MTLKPLLLIKSGSGTYSNPYAVHSPLLSKLEKITCKGYDREIQTVLALYDELKQTEVQFDSRVRILRRIKVVELKCRIMRPLYLKQREAEVRRQSNEQKAKRFADAAVKARQDLVDFARANPYVLRELRESSLWAPLLQNIN